MRFDILPVNLTSSLDIVDNIVLLYDCKVYGTWEHPIVRQWDKIYRDSGETHEYGWISLLDKYDTTVSDIRISLNHTVQRICDNYKKQEMYPVRVIYYYSAYYDQQKLQFFMVHNANERTLASFSLHQLS